MIREERLLELKKWLTADVISNDEELVEWAIETFPILIDEILMWRRLDRERQEEKNKNSQEV